MSLTDQEIKAIASVDDALKVAEQEAEKEFASFEDKLTKSIELAEDKLEAERVALENKLDEEASKATDSENEPSPIDAIRAELDGMTAKEIVKSYKRAEIQEFAKLLGLSTDGKQAEIAESIYEALSA